MLKLLWGLELPDLSFFRSYSCRLTLPCSHISLFRISIYKRVLTLSITLTDSPLATPNGLAYVTTMKVAPRSLLFVSSFIHWQTAMATIDCSGDCSACWKIGSPGVDIKIGCQFGSCPTSCPPGYEDRHCAKWQRCMCDEPSCKEFGPCLCGEDTDGSGWRRCKVPDGFLKCP